MQKFAIGLALIALVGCAPERKILEGNATAVVIQHDGSHAESTRLAAQHCASYGKNARLVLTEGWIMSFDCVAPE